MIKIYCILYEDVIIKLVEFIHVDKKSFSFPHFVDTLMRKAGHLIRFGLCTAEPMSCRKPNDKCLDPGSRTFMTPRAGRCSRSVSYPQVSVDVLHSSLQLLQLGSDHSSGWSYQGKLWKHALNIYVGARWKLCAKSCFCCGQRCSVCGRL